MDFGALTGRVVWVCPGGGLEPGEREEEAIRRELAEEAGLVDVEIGPCVWRREHVVPMLGGRWDGQSERFYVVRLDGAPPAPRPQFSVAQLALEYVTELRWWTPDALAASSETFAPRRLPALLLELQAALRAGRLPDSPLDVGI